VLLNHLDTGAAVLRDLIDVGAFHKAHADIGVAQAVSRARFTVAVEFKIRPRKNIVEELDVSDGIVRRIVHHQVPPKVEYCLTEWGQALCPALDALLTWAEARDVTTD
jgi:hypothetical protein